MSEADLPSSDAASGPASDDDVRVVVVDDDPDVAASIAEALEFDGYRVRIAEDGTRALVLIAEFLPHCVLLDVDMPGMSGDELSALLRERHGDDIVLVAVTGMREQDARARGTFGRVDHYLRKPLDLGQLRRLLPRISS
ncbi:MAG: response regulator [Caldimonas sp.]